MCVARNKCTFALIQQDFFFCCFLFLPADAAVLYFLFFSNQRLLRVEKQVRKKGQKKTRKKKKKVEGREGGVKGFLIQGWIRLERGGVPISQRPFRGKLEPSTF